MISIPGTFDPEKLSPVTHDLADHPLFEIGRLADLALKMPNDCVRYHSTSANAQTKFEKACDLHPPSIGIKQAIDNLENSGSWIAIHYAQLDQEYQRVLLENLRSIADTVEGKDPGMYWRVLWIFIQSPNSITPFHMDYENNFILQLKGNKRAYLWHPYDCLSHEQQEGFLGGESRSQVVFDESFKASAQVHDFKPGLGAYMPSGSPHLVYNQDNISITVSMTYCTRRTHQREIVYRCHHTLRKLGLTPPDYSGAGRDKLTYLGYKGFLKTRQALLGKSWLPNWMALKPYGV